GIVHEAPGEELAGGVVYRVLGEDLAHALQHAAVHLPFDAGVVYDRADVVHGRVADDLDGACLGIDLDLGDVAAVRGGRAELAFGNEVHGVRRLPGELLR